MKVTFLGTGTSQGVPVIGCDCPVCTSTDKKDQRLRAAILVSIGPTNIVIDVGPDFRQQLLRAKITKLDAILLTHEHNDHIIGMDDVRPLNFSQKKHIPVYANERVQTDLKKRFEYIFKAEPYPGAPRIELHIIQASKNFEVEGIPIIPIEVLHGQLPVLGFRFNNFTYITDAKTISDTELTKLRGTEILVLNALHHSLHHSHLNLEEALALIEKIQPKKAYLTHISHRMGLDKEVAEMLPDNVFLGYDGLALEV